MQFQYLICLGQQENVREKGDAESAHILRPHMDRESRKVSSTSSK